MQFAVVYPFLYKVLKPTFKNCLWTGDETIREIALTFDDGPHSQYTPELLKVLEEHRVPASFFWLGMCVERSPKIAQAVYQQGHWLGLHGYSHRTFTRLSYNELNRSLEQTQRAIARACDLPFTQVQQQVRDVRPPNGIFTPQILNWLLEWNYRPVMWSVVPEDWVQPGVQISVQRVLQQVTNGSLIVLHDGACGGQDVAATVAKLIPQLRQRGYEFVTIERLWKKSALRMSMTH